MLRQHLPDRNRSGRLRQAHVGQAFANLVSTADGRTALGSCRRLTHRRASLAFEAPIARPWISLLGPSAECSYGPGGETRLNSYVLGILLLPLRSVERQRASHRLSQFLNQT